MHLPDRTWTACPSPPQRQAYRPCTLESLEPGLHHGGTQRRSEGGKGGKGGVDFGPCNTKSSDQIDPT